EWLCVARPAMWRGDAAEPVMWVADSVLVFAAHSRRDLRRSFSLVSAVSHLRNPERRDWRRASAALAIALSSSLSSIPASVGSLLLSRWRIALILATARPCFTLFEKSVDFIAGLCSPARTPRSAPRPTGAYEL